MVTVVLAALDELNELERIHYGNLELGAAQVASILYNVNIDSKKGKAKSVHDFLFFRKEEEAEQDDLLPADVANACVALRHEEKLPPLLVGIWSHVLQRASADREVPSIRCMASEDETVVVIAPTWEGDNIRGFLAAKGWAGGEVVELIDSDRPLLSYRVKLPSKIQMIHYEAGVLLAIQDHRRLSAT